MADTSALLEEIQTGSIDENKARTKIEELISTVPGARGFFVSLLTGASTVGDRPPQFLIEALEKQKAIVSDLMIKNIVMATSMKIVHERNADRPAAQGSEQVVTRTSHLLNRLKRETTKSERESMQAALEASLTDTEPDAGAKDYTTFLSRWQYDLEQRQRALNVIKALNHTLQ